MAKNIHEIRDPIHVFVRLDSDERKVLDSRPFQRLRHIHQLALSYLVYPGATHKRFEHSLGVMELAGRVFDVITHKDAVTDEIRKLLPEITKDDARTYWRRVLRMAALCHDIGHLPFSHAAEDLLAPGWSHEKLTEQLILSDEMKSIWEQVTPPLRPSDIVKLAVGPEKAANLRFSNWEAILAEIIVGDAFGVDRIDYLLRDSHHAGVTYGRFDHFRLIDTLRILPSSPVKENESTTESSSDVPPGIRPAAAENQGPPEPTLGIQHGGLQTAEALLLARYFMYSQVYFHPIRRIYNIHLQEFLIQWLQEATFSTTIGDFLRMTDNEVTVALLDAAFDSTKSGHDSAKRIVCREHFKVLYERHPEDIQHNPDPGLAVFQAAEERYGIGLVRHDKQVPKGDTLDFPVLTRDERIASSMSMSSILATLPPSVVDYVFIVPEKREEARSWLQKNRAAIVRGR